MVRMASVVVPGYPHHLTQRGNRRQRRFSRKDDYQAYWELMDEGCGRSGVAVLGCCRMPNYGHLIVKVKPLLDLAPRWWEHVSADPQEEVIRRLRRSEWTSRPPGSEGFVKGLENIVGRVLRRQKPGPRRKDGAR
jgi:REP element-mobilizing transposase RayT